MARSTKQLRSPYDLLQSFRSLAAGWRAGTGSWMRWLPLMIRQLRIDTIRLSCAWHQHGACIANNGGQHIGRSRGGLTSKIHVVVDGNGLPVQLGLTGGQAHETGSARSCCDSSLGARGCWQIEATTRTGSGHLSPNGARGANIPPKRNRKDPICFSPYLYRDRNLVERFFNRSSSAGASRPDTTSSPLTISPSSSSPASRVWLRVSQSTA